MRIFILLAFFACANLVTGAPTAKSTTAATTVCNLPAPENLHIIDLNPTSATAVWDPVVGASAYWVKLTEEATGNIIFDNPVPTTYKAFTGLSSQMIYQVEVRAIDAVGCISPNSSQARFETPFIIIDEIIAEFPGTWQQPTSNITVSETDPVVLFKFSYNGSADEIFKYTFDPKEANSVTHDNPSTGVGSGYYGQGWQFSSTKALPPLSDNNVPSTNVYTSVSAYYLNTPTPIQNYDVNWSDFSLDFNLKTSDRSGLLDVTQSGGGTGIVNLWWAYPVVVNHRSSSSDDNTDNPLLSPNPFTNYLSVELTADQSAGSNIQLIDANGKTVRTAQTTDGQQQVWLETMGIQPGLYFVRCESAKAVKTYKVVKVAH